MCLPFSYPVFLAFPLIDTGVKILEYMDFWFDLGQLFLYLHIRFILEASIILEKYIVQTSKGD